MQLRYGNYSFAVNGCEVTSRTAVVRSDTGRPIRYRVSLDVLAYLTGDSQSALSAAERDLRAALLIPYQTLALLQDDGTPSSESIISNNAITGVVITDGPHFPEATNAEFVNRRTAKFSGEAEYVVSTAANAVIAYHEAVSITGNCGPITSWRRVVNAKPVFQVVYPFSTCRVVQAGRAVGHTGYPPPAAPLFPEANMHQERSRVVRESPRRVGPGPRAAVEWPISWSYEFESNVQLIALPSIPPL